MISSLAFCNFSTNRSYIFKKIYLFLAGWVFVAVPGLSLAILSVDYCLVAAFRLLLAVASPVAEHGL